MSKGYAVLPGKKMMFFTDADLLDMKNVITTPHVADNSKMNSTESR